MIRYLKQIKQKLNLQQKVSYYYFWKQ